MKICNFRYLFSCKHNPQNFNRRYLPSVRKIVRPLFMIPVAWVSDVLNTVCGLVIDRSDYATLKQPNSIFSFRNLISWIDFNECFQYNMSKKYAITLFARLVGTLNHPIQQINDKRSNIWGIQNIMYQYNLLNIYYISVLMLIWLMKT